jgi:hypothetical protein
VLFQPASNSLMFQTCSVHPASVAGVTLKAPCTLQELKWAKCRARATFKFSYFLLRAFVERVSLRIAIRI